MEQFQETQCPILPTLIPGPSGFSKIPSLIQYSRKPLELSTKLAQEYGDAVSLNLGSLRIYLLNHPHFIEEVLIKQNQNFIKDISYRFLAEMFGGGNGLFLLEGDIWKRHRQLMQSAFNSESIAAYAAMTIEETAQMLEKWQTGEVVDIHQDVSQLTIQIIGRAMFGVNLHETSPKISKIFENMMLRYFQHAALWFLLPLQWPTNGNRTIHHAARQINEIVSDIIDQRRISHESKTDLLSQMLQVQDADEGQLTPRELRDEVITLLTGHETTSITLTWVLILLAQYPDVEAKLRQELESILQGRLPTMSDLTQLRYTEMVIKETIRLYPPAWIIGREVISDCQIGNHHFNRGAVVYLNLWLVQRDPRFFDNPEQFYPERWEHNLEQSLPRFAYVPFGAGPRVCIGKAFAMMELILILAMIVQKFRLTPVSSAPTDVLPTFTLRPRQAVKMLLARQKG